MNLPMFNRNQHESDRDYRDRSWYVFLVIVLLILVKLFVH